MDIKPNSTNPLCYTSSPISSLPDWDQPFTDQELEAIDTVVLSAKSASVKRTSSITSPEDRNMSRRRLPGSLAHDRKSREFSYVCGLEPRSDSVLLRSCSKYQPQECMKRYPAIKFGGRVIYSRTYTEVEQSAAELLTFVEAKKQEMGQAAFGLDIEWKPTFRKDVPPGKAAVLQICRDNKHCYVMHIIHSGVPPNLRHLLENSSSIKVGAGIGNDCSKVYRDHDVSINNVRDLSILANQKLGDTRKWGLNSLSERLVSKKLEKPNKIRLGNWEVNVLSKAQLQYAATDAFVSWYLYEVLKTFPDAAETNS